MQHCHLEALSSLLLFIAHITLLFQTNIKIPKWPNEVILVFYITLWHTNGRIVCSSFLHKTQIETQDSWSPEHFHYRPRGGAKM